MKCHAIIPCNSAHQPGWLELRQQLWPHHAADDMLAEMTMFCASPERYAQYMALSEAAVPLGFVEVSLRTDYVNGSHSSPVAFLEGLFVIPTARKRGLARALVAMAQEWGKAHGCTEIASDALLSNEASHAMHRALGFRETERVVFFCKALA